MLLEAFRNHKRWLMFIAMVLIIPSFVVTGIYSYNRMMSDDGAIAKVDGESVLPQQYDELKRRQLEQLRSRMGEQFRANVLDSREARIQLLENLLSERSLQNEVFSENIIISDGTAIEMIKTFPAFQVNGKFDSERYKQYLASAGYSDEYFVQMVRRDVARELLTNGVSGSAVFPASQIERVNRMLAEERTVALYSLNAQDFMAGISVTDAQAKAYWDGHQKEFEVPDAIDVQYVVLTPELFGGAKPTEEDVKTFYEQNQNRFRVAEQRRASHILIDAAKGDEQAKKQAEEILAQVKADPTKFAALAKEFSADPGSAVQGGDLGFFGRGMMVAPFDSAVFSGKKGDIVGPVKTDFGYHIISITDVHPASVRPLDEVRGQIEHLYAEQKALERFSAEADNFTNMVYEQSESLQSVIEKYGLKPVTLTGVSAAGPTDRAEAKFLNAHVMEALFSDECLKEKRNSQAIEVAQNTLVAARVTKYAPSHVRPFEEAKADIVALLKNEQALVKAEKAGAEKLAALRDGKGGVDFSAEKTIARSNLNGETADLVNSVMRAQVDKYPAYIGVRQPDAYIIAKIVKTEMPKTSEQQLAAAQTELGGMSGRSEVNAYLAALREKHKATVLNKEYLPEEPAQK